MATGDGQCGAWAEIFIDMLKVQDIASTKVTVVEMTMPMTRGFLVKDWTFTGPGVSPATTPYVYVVGLDVIDAFGVAGQSNPDPPPSFLNHFIVRYSGQYYDPSYGTGPFVDQMAWENASLDGFTAAGTYMGNPATFAKKNDPALLETIFVP